jgi:phosphate-selective porin
MKLIKEKFDFEFRDILIEKSKLEKIYYTKNYDFVANYFNLLSIEMTYDNMQYTFQYGTLEEFNNDIELLSKNFDLRVSEYL